MTIIPTNTASLMRRNTTANIARRLQHPGTLPPVIPSPTLDRGLPDPILPIPPVSQPPVTDPFTPDTSRLPPRLPPQPAPGWNTNPNPNANPAWITYESLMRSAGRPIEEHLDAGGSQTMDFEEPPLSVGGGLPPPDIPPIGNSNIPNGPPMWGNPPGTSWTPSGGNQTGGNYDPYGWPYNGPPVWNTPGSNNTSTSGGPFTSPRFGDPGSSSGGPSSSRFSGGNSTFNRGPHIPGSGGRVGTGTTDPRPFWNQRNEPWYGRVARALMPYGTGQAAHALMNAYRRNQLRGTVGGPAHAVRRSGSPQTNPAPAGPASRPGTRFDYARGRYVDANNASGAQHNSRAANAMLMWSQSHGGTPNMGGLARTMVGTGDAGLTRFQGGTTGVHGRIVNGVLQPVASTGTFTQRSAPRGPAPQFPSAGDPNFAAKMALWNRWRTGG